VRIGLLGGTGPEGRGLAVRFARAGHDVVIGSRDATRAAGVASAVRAASTDGGASPTGAVNRDAAARAEMVFVTVPYAGMLTTLEALGHELAGKICVCTVAPIEMVGGQARLKPVDGSAAEEAARAVRSARWVAALHTVPASDLLRGEEPLATDTLVCGDDAAARTAVLEVLACIPGLRGVDAGSLANARYLEGATALLINVNRLHRAHASLRVVGI
jgi:8-hydroxy-5-deazaflavin:NADPH oxidoreductase